MKITLSWITRKRTSQLSFSIASFVTNADNNNDIEYLFAIDDDDTDTENTINQLNPFVKRCGSELKVMKTKRHGYDYLNEYDNEICKIFTGHCIIFVTDDMFCLTKGWDTRIREELKNYLDEPVLIHTQPWEDRQKFWPTMPGITRKWYEVTEHVAGWTSADLYLHWLAEDADLRIVKPDYEVHQLSRLYAGERENWTEVDETHEEGRGRAIAGKEHRHSRKDDEGYSRDDNRGEYYEDLQKLKKWKENNG